MNVKETLRRLDIQPSKRRGQNFLVDTSIAQRLADFSGVREGDAVLEIGPGLGVLTEKLLAKKANLAVVEIEEKFCSHLSGEFRELSGRIFCEDARSLDLSAVLNLLGSDKLTIVSNVPYSISTDIVLWVLENTQVIDKAALLLQEEFAERIAAPPGGKSYGAITVHRALLAEAELGPRVGGGSFHPKANVESRALLLRTREKPAYDVNREVFRNVVRAAFSQRRKTLLNSLSAGFPDLSKIDCESLLNELGIDPKRRAETLSLAEFASLAERLS